MSDDKVHRIYADEPPLMQRLTPTQRRMMLLLADGELHRKRELQDLLNDDLAATNHRSSIHWHLLMLRRELKKSNETIACLHLDGETWYQHRRLLTR